MRIRQAHAIITALQALEAMRGYEFAAFEHDHPENASSVDDDYVTGNIEIETGAPKPVFYDIVLRPDSAGRTVTAEVTRDFEHVVLRQVVEVWAPPTVNAFSAAGSLLAAQIDSAIQADAARLARTPDPTASTEDDPS